MDFINGQELLDLCTEHQCSISNIMLQREIIIGEKPIEKINKKLETALNIMKDSAHAPLTNPQKSIGGLLGGEAKSLYEFSLNTTPLCGTVLSKAIAYSMAVLEVNATMGLIVAAPTAGSSGVVPGCILAATEEFNFSNEILKNGLLNTSAIGYILMRNASVSGAEAGCQAEVGSASAMAASALVEMLGGTPEMSLQAASLALSNLLGLVCDPIAGLVESPCQSRNAIGVSNAFTCAQLALSGITHPVPFDEMVEAMYRVGRSLPFELRETAMGGNASTPTGCALGCSSCSK
ncbi:MAG: L-serine ammonia-lyase, iron-sulfur-dependent, subunit alpha [Eubacteriales bacterium]